MPGLVSERNSSSWIVATEPATGTGGRIILVMKPGQDPTIGTYLASAQAASTLDVWRSEPVPTVAGETELLREVLIAGEEFLLEREGGQLFIRHPRWSLVGSGDNYREALVDLFSEMALAREIVARIDVENCSPSLLSMRDYLARIA